MPSILALSPAPIKISSAWSKGKRSIYIATRTMFPPALDLQNMRQHCRQARLGHVNVSQLAHYGALYHAAKTNHISPGLVGFHIGLAVAYHH